jgi:hypothetical protein
MGLISFLIVFLSASYLGASDPDPIQSYHPGPFCRYLGKIYRSTLVEHGASAIARFAEVQLNEIQIQILIKCIGLSCACLP